MLGLGLRGLFICLVRVDIYFNLREGVEEIIIANLLGMAASNSLHPDTLLDINVYKAIVVHLQCITDSGILFKLSREIQSAALVALGILFKGLARKLET